jgi:hypothetical protein
MTSTEMLSLEQGSELWVAARRGLVTASRMSDVIATLKRKKKDDGGKCETAARRNYRMELAIEILTGQPFPHYVSQDMQWGLDQEPFARAAYEIKRDTLVETGGFFVHPTVERFGASPDFMVGSEGLGQIKCPTTATHLGWVREKVIPIEHAAQMLAELACTGREWNDFVSFDPRLPEHLQLFIRRMERRDHEFLIERLEVEVNRFNADLDNFLAELPEPADAPQAIVALMDHVDPTELPF